MKVIKKINNNVAVALDGNFREVVIFGKGVGFPKLPYELTDLSKIDRTFYDVEERYYKLFEEINTDFFNFVSYMVDVVQAGLPGDWDKNLAFILSDHFNFSIQRIKKGMRVGFPYSFDIEVEFPQFNKYAKWMVHQINKRMNVHLEKGEVTCVAMHLINAHEGTKNEGVENVSERSNRILNRVTKIIEDNYQLEINRNDTNYYRFRYHILYFVKRKENAKEVIDENLKLFESMKEAYPKAYACVCEIEQYLLEEFQGECSKDELLYLMIHINRLCSKEDCNRKGITPEK